MEKKSPDHVHTQPYMEDGFRLHDCFVSVDVGPVAKVAGCLHDFVLALFFHRFTSGSTATVLTVPNTVKWPDWFSGTLEANRVYEINIMDGIYGVVMSWA